MKLLLALIFVSSAALLLVFQPPIWDRQGIPPDRAKNSNTKAGCQTVRDGANQSGATKGELLRIERQWIEAYVRHDRETLDHLLADEFTWTFPLGTVASKAQLLAGVENPNLAVEAMSIEESNVLLYEDTAVVTGRLTLKAQGASGAHRYTAVYVKCSGRWRAVAFQSSRIV